MPTVIKSSDVTIKGDTVRIKGKGGQVLLKSLIQKHSNTLMELTDRVGVVSPAEISIGKDGSVELRGKKIAANAKRILQSDAGFFDTNCQCGGGSGTMSW